MDFSDYKGIYVVAIPKYGEMQKVTGELIGASRELAAELNESVSVVLVGSEIRDKAQELIHLGAASFTLWMHRFYAMMVWHIRRL